eukprot:GEMP01054281.1.p1 GENE.GEMP01054281.1~~GEMP01054281.1.p1  ORF type:complete len:258 (+),score=43.00 GEMP01054281.1:192-965(+)
MLGQINKAKGPPGNYPSLRTNKCAYCGQWNAHGYFSGQGRYQSNNCVYTGQFEDGAFHGFGKYEGVGGLYIGDWSDGKRHGYGKHELKGDTYVGQWSNDLPHGEGLRWSQDLKTRHPLWGWWIYGQPVGLHYLDKIPHWFLTQGSKFVGHFLPVLWDEPTDIALDNETGSMLIYVSPAQSEEETSGDLKLRSIGTVHADSVVAPLCVSLEKLSRTAIVFKISTPSMQVSALNVNISVEVIPFNKASQIIYLSGIYTQ